MSCLSEVQEIEKPKGISVFIQVRRDPTLHPESDLKADTSREQEEEDDLID
jgi:hypothetical protein